MIDSCDFSNVLENRPKFAGNILGSPPPLRIRCCPLTVYDKVIGVVDSDNPSPYPSGPVSSVSLAQSMVNIFPDVLYLVLK